MRGFAVSVEPGGGMVARWETGLVVVTSSDGRTGDLVQELRRAVGDEPKSADLIRELRHERFERPGIGLAAAVDTPGGAKVFVRGPMEIRTERDETLHGEPALERDLAEPVALWLGSGGPPVINGHPVMNLERGVVTGRGAVVYLRRAAQAPADTAPSEAASGDTAPAETAAVDTAPEPSEPDDEPTLAVPAVEPVVADAPAATDGAAVAAEPSPPANPVSAGSDAGLFEPIDWRAEAAETREPLPLATGLDSQTSTELTSAGEVLGIRCSRGHFNNPKAGYCQVCGISMVHITHRLEPGPRPTLGFVVFADGATYALDRSYLIGRSPTPADGSGLTPLVSQDHTQSVSREHAELRLVGWDVHYVDLNSTNGSYLWSTELGRWDRLEPDQAVTLKSGVTVSVGRMTFVFQGASKPVGATSQHLPVAPTSPPPGISG